MGEARAGGARIMPAGLVVLGLGLIPVTGCQDEGRNRGMERAGAIVVSGESPEDAESADQAGAGIGGTLEIEGGCAYLAADGIRYFPVWPPGTSWSDDTETIGLQGGAQLEAGDEVTGSGVYLDPAGPGAAAIREVRSLADECVGPADEVPVFNPNGQIKRADRS